MVIRNTWFLIEQYKRSVVLFYFFQYLSAVFLTNFFQKICGQKVYEKTTLKKFQPALFSIKLLSLKSNLSKIKQTQRRASKDCLSKKKKIYCKNNFSIRTTTMPIEVSIYK